MYKLAKIPRQIGKVVKDKRIEMGYTQAQLAELSNTSRSLLYRLEKGATNGIALDKLFSILAVLELGIAITDEEDGLKRIQTAVVDAEDDYSKEEPQSQASSLEASRKDESKAGTLQSVESQFERELKAAQNIKGFNVLRSLRG